MERERLEVERMNAQNESLRLHIELARLQQAQPTQG